MSEIRVNILDAESAIHGDIHGSFTEALVASLMAEPETIGEFRTALARFVKPTETWEPLGHFRSGEGFEPYDAGILIIDLAARVIGYETTYSYPSHEGRVRIDAEFADFAEDDGYVYIAFKIPTDWKIVPGIPEFEGMSSKCRRERLSVEPFDAREILFGRPMIEFLLDSLSNVDDLTSESLFSDIHASWLMTPRVDLQNKTPRQVLFEKRESIGFDLQSREFQYSFTKLCPKPIPSDSYAYRYAGFGNHEIIVYYYLVRELLYESVEPLRNLETWNREYEIARLEALRDSWLGCPNSEFSRAPANILESERKRLNLVASAEECLLDDNCPCCIAMYEDFDTPMFWHFDGCNMDEQFEFSLYDTREEWEEEQERYRQLDAEFAARKADGWTVDPFDDGEPPF